MAVLRACRRRKVPVNAAAEETNYQKSIGSRNCVLGIVGAIIGGWVKTEFGREGVTGFNLYSMLVAIGGAILVLVIYHAIRGTSSRSIP
jgi:uncharacterized membrane protein YeaQ/YmgE (transglycosylase-associated protein family)